MYAVQKSIIYFRYNFPFNLLASVLFFLFPVHVYAYIQVRKIFGGKITAFFGHKCAKIEQICKLIAIFANSTLQNEGFSAKNANYFNKNLLKFACFNIFL